MKNSYLSSMTAYAVAEGKVGSQDFRMNLKSVNHRFFEMRWRAPRAWTSWEIKVRQDLQKKLKRGSLDFWIEEIQVHNSKVGEKSESQKFFLGLQAELGTLKGLSPFLIPPPLRAYILARNLELWNKSENTSVKDENEERDFFVLLEKTVEELLQKRAVEGQSLADLLKGFCEELAKYRNGIAGRLPQVRMDWEKNLKKRFAELAEEFKVASLAEDRLLNELLLIAERRDVSEELGRIETHLESLKKFLAEAPENAGKRLEFLIQELHREWTTLGNKVQNSAESSNIMEAKLILEQMREQCANLA